ncbi:hypothetical protein, partial [Pseudomonas lurida]|uniref:hypothetical protein n=1 Tax=Pseudomonas lurida TaxID=244566 RepID=UPI0034D98441
FFVVFLYLINFEKNIKPFGFHPSGCAIRCFGGVFLVFGGGKHLIWFGICLVFCFVYFIFCGLEFLILWGLGVIHD